MKYLAHFVLIRKPRNSSMFVVIEILLGHQIISFGFIWN